MYARLVTIDNTKYVLIPEELLNETGIASEVSIQVEGNSLIIRPAKNPRAGWTKAFRAMHENGDDVLLEDELGNALEGRW